MSCPSWSTDGPGRAHATVDRSWWSWAGPHGGLLAGLLLQVAGPLAGAGRAPRALSAQFLAAPAGEHAELEGHLLRAGGSTSVVRADLRSAGQLAVTATVTSARPRQAGSPYDRVPAPAVPPPEDCQPLELPSEVVPFAAHLEYRPGPGTMTIGGSAEAAQLAWVRLRTDRPYDAASLVVLTDVLPPALYATTGTPVPVPTVDLQVTLADAPPAAGWVLTHIASRTSAGGWCVDDSEVWDRRGRLLAQARQVRRVLGSAG